MNKTVAIEERNAATGELVRTWPSQVEAARALQISPDAVAMRVLRGTEINGNVLLKPSPRPSRTSPRPVQARNLEDGRILRADSAEELVQEFLSQGLPSSENLIEFILGDVSPFCEDVSQPDVFIIVFQIPVLVDKIDGQLASVFNEDKNVSYGIDVLIVVDEVASVAGAGLAVPRPGSACEFLPRDLSILRGSSTWPPYAPVARPRPLRNGNGHGRVWVPQPPLIPRSLALAGQARRGRMSWRRW